MSAVTNAVNRQAPIAADPLSATALFRRYYHQVRNRAETWLALLRGWRAPARRLVSTLLGERFFWVVFALLVLLYVLFMFTQSRNFRPGG